MEELNEQLGRYTRLLENEDFTKTIKELEEAYGLNDSCFKALNCPNATEYMWAQGGMRTFINRLNGLVKETEQRIENYKEGEDENE